MKVQNLKANPEQESISTVHAASMSGLSVETSNLSDPTSGTTPKNSNKQELEIALLQLRIQHLELVVDTARSLLGSNQDRLLRRLYEIPREIVSVTTQLQRVDPHATW